MKPGTFYSLVAITAIAAAAAGVAVSMQTNLTTLSAGTEPAFPTLEKNINDAAKIEDLRQCNHHQEVDLLDCVHPLHDRNETHCPNESDSLQLR